MRKQVFYCLIVFISLFLFACQNNTYTPKPKGYFKINFPQKKYLSLNTNAPFNFQYPSYATLEADKQDVDRKFWYNLHFKQFNGYLHLTYYDVDSKNKFNQLVEDARALVYKHTVKASAIDQKIIYYPERKVYGIYYAIEGNNTASWVQFFLTDSAKHYFRGALYFNERPQYDSIEPVVNFIKKDIDRIIETFNWKNK